MVYFFIIDGHKFAVTPKTLEKYKSSLLYEIATSKESTVDFIEKDGNDIYIDMDIHNFNNIIKLMRGYKVTIDSDLEQDILRLKLNSLLPSSKETTKQEPTKEIENLISDTSVDQTMSSGVFFRKLASQNAGKVDNATVVSDINFTMTDKARTQTQTQVDTTSKKTVRPKKTDIN